MICPFECQQFVITQKSQVRIARTWSISHETSHLRSVPINAACLLLDTYYCSNRKTPDDGGRCRIENYKQRIFCPWTASWTGLKVVLQNSLKWAFNGVCKVLGHTTLQITPIELRTKKIKRKDHCHRVFSSRNALL